MLIFSDLTRKIGVIVYFLLQLDLDTYAQLSRKIEINGKLNTNYNGPISLKYHFVPDSALRYETMVLNGDFSFNIDLIEPVSAVLSLPEPSKSEYMYLDTSAMFIEANIDSSSIESKFIKSLKIINVEGSKSHTVYKTLMKRWKSITESGFSEKIQSELLFSALDSLVKEYPDNNIVTQALLFAEILSYDQAQKIHNQLSIKQQNRSTVNGLSKLLARLKRTDIGTKVFLKDIKNETGDPITLDSLTSSITLLDFWASWCYPCRAKHPELKNLYTKYQAKGFNIISISLDKDKSKWLKAIDDDNITWINGSDLQGYSGYMASFYGLNYIPFNLLINDHFKIIGKNVTVSDLKNILRDKL